ncbi:3-keto-disaccharide hydrolase [Neorhodopirellula lusitana]|uniref:3-keto-disaccharide hydrolase n=1 Tax=Neorhodopirellula lusitana TaxID=445327 RepID=UPI00384DC8DA
MKKLSTLPVAVKKTARMSGSKCSIRFSSEDDNEMMLQSSNRRRAALAGLTFSLAVACFSVVCLSALTSVSAGEIDPQQKAWYEQYKTQENVPAPGEMLLNEDPEPELTDGFTDLFNGKDLTGWKPLGGTCKFEVKDQQIIGTCVPGSNSTYLCTERSDFKNFVFTCEMDWLVDGNTGVMFRSRMKANPKAKADTDSTKVVYGPQLELEGFSKDRHWSGGVYGQSCGGYFYPLWLKDHVEARAALKDKQWNRVTISAEGNVVKTWVNGVPAAYWIDDGSYPEGFFGLQIHKGKAGKVRFKNLRVKELP